MQELQNYKEPYWTHTTLMESMFFQGITSIRKALTLMQMSYVLGENETNTTLILNHLVSEKFLKNEGFMYYLDELGIHHAKKRIKTFEENLKLWKEGKFQDWQVKLITDLREKFSSRIKDVKSKKIKAKLNTSTNELEDLKKRIAILEEKFNKMKEIFEK